ncbi:MAG: hypothetical protein R3191_02795 [Anaerolineales bacterium]|nr:hypothetical protein [Anaerolineales bacterium]
MLERALTPVEPDRQFIHRLRARLVHYQGQGMSPIWAMVTGLAVATLLVVTSLAVALRLLLSLLSLIGEDRRERSAAVEGTSSTG